MNSIPHISPGDLFIYNLTPEQEDERYGLEEMATCRAKHADNWRLPKMGDFYRFSHEISESQSRRRALLYPVDGSKPLYAPLDAFIPYMP